MTLAVILAGFAMFTSGATFLAVLVLLGRGDFHYATKSDLHDVTQRLNNVGRNQSKLWRYMEAVDDATDGSGHRVLIAGLRFDVPASGD